MTDMDDRTVDRMSRMRRTGRRLFAIAWVLGFLGTGLVTNGVFNIIRIVTHPETTPPWGWLVTLASWALGITSVVACNDVGREADRYSAAARPSEPATSSPGPSVLYLRSFRDDERLARPQRHPAPVGLWRQFITVERSEEQHLVAALNMVGPVVTAEVPGQELQYRGARRVTLSDDWKASIRELMAGAELVVIVLADTKGVIWELGEAVRTVPLARIVLVVAMTRPEYDEFCVHLPQVWRDVLDDDATLAAEEPVLPQMPKFGGREQARARITGLIRYTADGSASFVPMRHYAGWYNSLDEMVYRAMEDELPIRNIYEGGDHGAEVHPVWRAVAVMAAVASFPFFAALGVIDTSSISAVAGWLGRLAAPVLLVALAVTLWTGVLNHRSR